jgi:hypothetical protein
LYAYMHGIVENHASKLILGNGTANHSHLLISLGKTVHRRSYRSRQT